MTTEATCQPMYVRYITILSFKTFAMIHSVTNDNRTRGPRGIVLVSTGSIEDPKGIPMSRTEAISPRYKGLDTWDDGEILCALWESQLSAISVIRSALPALTTAARAIVEHLRAAPASRLVYAGMGTSGLLAVLDGMELSPTFGWPADRLAFLMAGGDLARFTLDGSAEDDAASARRDVAKLAMTPHDVVIGVSASGKTPYTVAAMQEARAIGALTIGLANNPDTELLLASRVPVLLDTGAEVIAG